MRIDERSVVPAVLLGMGLGGFVDGILLHQVAQWHHMGSAVLAPTSMEAMSRNMLWDGLFHLATLVLVTFAVFLLLQDARHGLRMPTTKAFTGLLLLGWGTFNLIEGVVDHHILELHHVRDLPRHLPWLDWLFLVIGGVGFVVLGRVLAKDREKAPAAPPSEPAIP